MTSTNKLGLLVFIAGMVGLQNTILMKSNLFNLLFSMIFVGIGIILFMLEDE